MRPARALGEWVSREMEPLASRAHTIQCLRWDSVVSRKWAGSVLSLMCKGESMPPLGGMIAASARAYSLTGVTRNVRDFAKAGVRVLNPFG